MINGRGKHWCFTINNYDELAQERLRALAADKERVSYLVWGREKGERGTPHLQGFISFVNKCRWVSVKEAIGARCHIEVARGTPFEAASYCKKDADFEEFGQLPVGGGKRSDLDSIARSIQSGASLREIQESYGGTYLRYRRSIRDEIADRVPPRLHAPTVKILWGPTGTGKTRSVYDFHLLEKIYKHDGGDWFDGYDGHDVVLFDDYSGSDFKLTYLLKLCDRYPMRVPVKGGFVQFRPLVIYFTSNVDPSEWYQNAKQAHRDAFFRRVSEIIHMDHSA